MPLSTQERLELWRTISRHVADALRITISIRVGSDEEPYIEADAREERLGCVVWEKD